MDQTEIQALYEEAEAEALKVSDLKSLYEVKVKFLGKKESFLFL